MPTHVQRQNIIGRSVSSVLKAVAPVLFGPERGRISFRGPISPAVADFFARANIVALEVQNKFAAEAIEITQNLKDLGDNLTDLAGSLPAGERTAFINQAQELLDVPLNTLAGAWAQTLNTLIGLNKQSVKAAKQRQKERGTR